MPLPTQTARSLKAARKNLERAKKPVSLRAYHVMEIDEHIAWIDRFLVAHTAEHGGYSAKDGPGGKNAIN